MAENDADTAHHGGAEPQLRYERLGGDLKAILAETRVTVLALSPKLLAIGTSDGSVAILDYSGNQVRGAMHACRASLSSVGRKKKRRMMMRKRRKNDAGDDDDDARSLARRLFADAL
jgi:hypothetical protein